MWNESNWLKTVFSDSGDFMRMDHPLSISGWKHQALPLLRKGRCLLLLSVHHHLRLNELQFWFNLLRLLTPVNHWFKHTCRPSHSYARLTWHSYVCLVRRHMSHWTRIDCHGGVMNVPGHEVTDCGDKHFYCCCWWCPAPHRCPFLSCQIYSTSIPLSTIVVPHNTTEGVLSARTAILSLFQFHTPESKACATGSWHNIHMGTAHWFSLKSWECAHLFRHWR